MKHDELPVDDVACAILEFCGMVDMCRWRRVSHRWHELARVMQGPCWALEELAAARSLTHLSYTGLNLAWASATETFSPSGTQHLCGMASVAGSMETPPGYAYADKSEEFEKFRRRVRLLHAVLDAVHAGAVTARAQTHLKQPTWPYFVGFFAALCKDRVKVVLRSDVATLLTDLRAAASQCRALTAALAFCRHEGNLHTVSGVGTALSEATRHLKTMSENIDGVVLRAVPPDGSACDPSIPSRGHPSPRRGISRLRWKVEGGVPTEGPPAGP